MENKMIDNHHHHSWLLARFFSHTPRSCQSGASPRGGKKLITLTANRHGQKKNGSLTLSMSHPGCLMTGSLSYL